METQNKILWLQIPSVTTGGAKYFYIHWSGEIGMSQKHTIIYNRITGKWDIEGICKYSPITKRYEAPIISSGFNTAKDAIKYYNNIKVK